VDQEGLLGHCLRGNVRANRAGSVLGTDRVHQIVVQPHGMESARRAARQDDRSIERVSHPIFQMRSGVDVDVQQRVALAKLAQPREQALAAEHRQHAQSQAQQRNIVRLALHRAGERFHVRVHRLVKGLAFIRQLHRLARAGEQLLSDEFFKVADPPRQGRGAEADLLGGRPRRAEADSAHEGLKRAQGGQTTCRHELSLLE